MKYASLLVAASVAFAGNEKMAPAYNTPARTEVHSSWDMYVTGSFLYWQLTQDNMDVAFLSKVLNSSYLSQSQVSGEYIPMRFDFVNGLEVGVGFNFDHDDWDLFGGYTRVHSRNHKNVDSYTLSNGQKAPLLPNWGSPYILPNNVYNTGYEIWKCNLDFGDLQLGRTYFAGQDLTFRPYLGLRYALITQALHVHYTNWGFINGTGLVEVPGNMDVFANIHSWGLGPRVGINTSWLLGFDIRLFSDLNVDLLYTKYHITNQTAYIVTINEAPYTPGQILFDSTSKRYGTVRAHVDLDAGCGWGTYFDHDNYYIDLSAAYQFQIFFDQNLLVLGQTAGDLYAQGLTATARLDF